MASDGNKAAYEIDVRDVEYLRHGDTPYLARLYQPRGQGPFPVVVEVHGGAWCRNDRLEGTYLHEPLARSGVVVLALDFRMPPAASYPGSIQDINYGVRWIKANAREFKADPTRIALSGSSSGGHQSMLVAMKPFDPRYCALPLPPGGPVVDARVNCVVMLWPVISPIGRYHHAKKFKAAGKPYPEFVDLVIPAQDAYWVTEDNMIDGNPVLALERGDKVELPPALYVQGTADIVHPRADLDRFVANYRRAGGKVELMLVPDEGGGWIKEDPTKASSQLVIKRVVEFIHEQLGAGAGAGAGHAAAAAS